MKRVLVVDDEPDYPQLLSIILTKEGFEVRTAGDGDEARRIAAHFLPDVLVVDWLLDGAEDGLQVADAVTHLNPRLQTVLITGYPSVALEQRVAQMPTVRFLTKPFTPSHLVELVRDAAAQS
ncbi:MAG TPA: response regulator [Thermoguttaceae bacterium]|nr:response regulator [Thermoguttaceae bacterium]